MNLISVGIIALIVLCVVGFLANCYKKVGPNEVLIITGGMLTGPYVVVNTVSAKQ